ncbi:MAG TPA: efflux RND transporter periplasmic adaptor subunit [Polyangia bacterium]
MTTSTKTNTMTRSVLLASVILSGLPLATACKDANETNLAHDDHAAAPARDSEAAPHLDHFPPGYAAVEVDEARQQTLGIKTLVVSRQTIERSIRTVGIVATDETRTSHVHVKFDGFIEEVFVDYVGKPVRKGQPLLRMFSRELLAAEQEYLASRAAIDRTGTATKTTTKTTTTTTTTRSVVEPLVAAARERLRLFDVPEAVLRRIERTGIAERTVTIVSPRTGTVIEKQALEGLAVTPMAHLYVIADLSRVWVLADVYERDLAQVEISQSADLRLDAMPGRTFRGTVSFISPVLDPTTRTAKVRFEYPNPDGALRPGMYATVQITAGQGEGLVVPSDSIIDTGERKIVFVARGKGRFEPRALKTGAATANQYEVLAGLREGDAIASNGQFLLDSESRIKGARTGGAPVGHVGH